MKAENVKPKVSFGNLKLPKETMIFNIPAVTTCPFKTAWCARNCYALKAERLYKAVRPAREYNLTLTRREDFADVMALQIERALHKIKQVRIHESGDFYRQSYLDAWFTVAKRFPALTFYAYTKSFWLDFSAKPANFKLIASFDASTPPDRMAMYQERKRFFDNTFTVVDRKAKATCIADCTVCSKCWTKKGLKITVNQH
jgi:hypothetical protein